MKTAISLPDELFKAAETLAGRMGVSRSRLYANALEEYIDRHQARRVSERLDAVYGAESSSVDPSIRAAQARVLKRPEW
jgi:metal-responsive CopG/Arc/MetJ family transcriptional regulator